MVTTFFSGDHKKIAEVFGRKLNPAVVHRF